MAKIGKDESTVMVVQVGRVMFMPVEVTIREGAVALELVVEEARELGSWC